MRHFTYSLVVLLTIVIVSSCCTMEKVGRTISKGGWEVRLFARTIAFNHRHRTRLVIPRYFNSVSTRSKERFDLVERRRDEIPGDSMLRLDYDGKPYTRGRRPHRNGIDSLYYNYYDYWYNKHREGYTRYFPLNRKDWRNDTCIAYLTYTSYPQVIDTFMVTRYRVKGKLFRRYRSYVNGIENYMFHPYKERPRAVGY